MSYTLFGVQYEDYDKGDDLGEGNEGRGDDDDDEEEENDHDYLHPQKDVLHAMCCTI